MKASAQRANALKIVCQINLLYLVSCSAYLSCQNFSKHVVQEVGTKTHYFESKIQPYGLILHPQVEECDILLFLWNLFVVQIKKKSVFLSTESHLWRNTLLEWPSWEISKSLSKGSKLNCGVYSALGSLGDIPKVCTFSAWFSKFVQQEKRLERY